MKHRLWFLVAAVATSSGCYLGGPHTTGGPNDALTSSGGAAAGSDITFQWSFSGMTCAQAGVETVKVTIPGELLENDGQYPCSGTDGDGITLTRFYPGTYSYQLDATDSTGQTVWTGSGEVDVIGDRETAVLDLSPTSSDHHGDDGNQDAGCDGGTDGGGGGGTPPGGSVDDGGTGGGTVDAGTDAGVPDSGTVDDGGTDAGTIDAGTDAGTPDAGSTDGGTGGGTCGCGTHDGGTPEPVHNYLSWTFPQVANAPLCGDELTQVVLTIDGQPYPHECGAGLFPSRITLPDLSAGDHAIAIDAVGTDGESWAHTDVTMNVPASTSDYEIFPVPWIVGSAALDWTFFDCYGTAYAGCSQAGVETVGINFADANGQWMWADARNVPLDLAKSCSETAGSKTVLRALVPGNYAAFVAGYGPRSSGLEFLMSPQADPQVSVKAGVFLTPSSPTSSFTSVNLYQQ
jgi:hypothetical protein